MIRWQPWQLPGAGCWDPCSSWICCSNLCLAHWWSAVSQGASCGNLDIGQGSVCTTASKPWPSKPIDLRNSCYIFLRATGFNCPLRVARASDYRHIINDFRDGSIFHGSASQAEARADCEAVGVIYPASWYQWSSQWARFKIEWKSPTVLFWPPTGLEGETMAIAFLDMRRQGGLLAGAADRLCPSGRLASGITYRRFCFAWASYSFAGPGRSSSSWTYQVRRFWSGSRRRHGRGWRGRCRPYVRSNGLRWLFRVDGPISDTQKKEQPSLLLQNPSQRTSTRRQSNLLRAPNQISNKKQLEERWGGRRWAQGSS